jgi:hypothetical protein
MELDLDKARAARMEAKGEGHTFVFGEVQFALPAELPYAAVEAIEAGNFRSAMGFILNGTTEKFFALNPSTQDIEALVTGMIDMYVPGSSLGESSASSPSLPTGGKKSRQASSANTTSS